MTEFKEVMKQFNRMCDNHKWCDTCQIDEKNRGRYMCSRWLTEHPTKAEEIVMQWAEEHPLITNRDKFREVFEFDISDLFTLGMSRDLQNWLEKEYKEPKDE